MDPSGLAEASIATALPLDFLGLMLLPLPLTGTLNQLLACKSQSLRVCFPSNRIYNGDFGAESHATDWQRGLPSLVLDGVPVAPGIQFGS